MSKESISFDRLDPHRRVEMSDALDQPIATSISVSTHALVFVHKR